MMDAQWRNSHYMSRSGFEQTPPIPQPAYQPPAVIIPPVEPVPVSANAEPLSLHVLPVEMLATYVEAETAPGG